jgi:hypothetical protein
MTRLPVLLIFFLFTPNLMANLHDPLNELLKKHVHEDQVDYKSLLTKKSVLNSYLKKLENLDISKLNRNEEMAMWINAYNACTVMLILNHYPVESIKDIPTSKRWKWQGWNIAGEMLSLDEIEHVKLRPMGEPRIHFAINCASKSCPNLLAEAFVAHKLESQLSRATKAFLNDEFRGMALKKSSSFLGFGSSESVHVSKIFSWFGGDFISTDGSLVSFLKKHASGEAAKLVKDLNDDNELSYLDYDWNLNGK